jgi:hypothetical protein
MDRIKREDTTSHKFGQRRLSYDDAARFYRVSRYMAGYRRPNQAHFLEQVAEDMTRVSIRDIEDLLPAETFGDWLEANRDRIQVYEEVAQ